MNSRQLFAILPAFLLFGCELPPVHFEPKDTFVSAAFTPPPAGSLVVLLPPDGVDPDLEKGERLVVEQLHKQLVRSGYRVAILGKENYRELWSQETNAVGGVFDSSTGNIKLVEYSKAIAQLARRVCAETKCSVLLRHRLVPRTAELAGRSARWDAVERVVPLSKTGGELWRFSGTTVGVSVELLGVTSEGVIAFRRFGGVSLPYAADMVGGRNTIREDAFAVDQEVAQGVSVALNPLVRRP